jgi:hypothetical protein
MLPASGYDRPSLPVYLILTPITCRSFLGSNLRSPPSVRPPGDDFGQRGIRSSGKLIEKDHCAYEQFGEVSFHEDLLARRMAAAAALLIEQPAIAIADVTRLVGYRQPSHFARAFRRRYGLAPAGFRERARKNGMHRGAARATPGGSHPG